MALQSGGEQLFFPFLMKTKDSELSEQNKLPLDQFSFPSPTPLPA